MQYLIPMPAIIPAPESFVIETVSHEVQEPENESYVIRLRLKDAYEVRSFLSDNGVNEKRIAFAFAELSRKGQVTVRKSA